jgi:creatinine amidohydrolase
VAGAASVPGAAQRSAASSAYPTPSRALASLAWPELSRLLAEGVRTAVVPLGSTEQHGPHLPFATDTRIADALAARFCERVPEAVALPAIALGCADEHLGFPGTLSLRAETLAAVLRDVLRSLERAGFERALVFSAHGGNAALLRELAPALDRECALEVTVAADHGALADALFAEAARAGVSAAAAGHHAGELETSILLALAPEDVRRERAAAGVLDVPPDPQALFYPDLRENAPSGVVGDPTAADAARAARYLDAWVDVLVERYRRAKKRA